MFIGWYIPRILYTIFDFIYPWLYCIPPSLCCFLAMVSRCLNISTYIFYYTWINLWVLIMGNCPDVRMCVRLTFWTSNKRRGGGGIFSSAYKSWMVRDILLLALSLIVVARASMIPMIVWSWSSDHRHVSRKSLSELINDMLCGKVDIMCSYISRFICAWERSKYSCKASCQKTLDDKRVSKVIQKQQQIISA